METNVCPKTWLVESILVTIFCCLPFGIIGIINASKVNSLYSDDQIAEAEAASENAKKWTRIGFFVGLAIFVIYLLVYLVALL